MLRYTFNSSTLKVNLNTSRYFSTRINTFYTNMNYNKSIFILSTTSITTLLFLSHSYNSRKKELLLEAQGEKEHKFFSGNQSIVNNCFKTAIIETFNKILLNPFRLICRLLFLVYCFSPVVLLSPICLFGKRMREYDNTKSGCLLWYSILVHQLEKAGATFIKLAQWAASRGDIFPKQMCIRLSRLHSSVRPHSYKKTLKILKESYEVDDLSEIFKNISSTPVGVGAIAQVYRAVLNENMLNENYKNREIALKVLHPNIELIISLDLKIMKFCAKILNILPTFKWLSLPEEVHTFGEMMKAQLDLRTEGFNLIKFNENFMNENQIRFPKPLMNISNKKVLVEEYEMSIPLKYIINSTKRTKFDEIIAELGLKSFLKMLLIHNFVHADLHPGNIMVQFYKDNFNEIVHFGKNKDMQNTIDESNYNKVVGIGKSKEYDAFATELDSFYEKGYKPQLVFIDAGLVASLDERNRNNFMELFKSIAEFNGYLSGKLMVERCRTPEEVVDKEGFANEIKELVNKVKARTFRLSTIQITDVLNNVMKSIQKHHVKLESDFINIVISILILEGTGRRLDPNLDLFKTALPILRNKGFMTVKNRDITSQISNKENWMLKLWVQLEAREFLQSLIPVFDEDNNSTRLNQFTITPYDIFAF